jgi:hypothetical protein
MPDGEPVFVRDAKILLDIARRIDNGGLPRGLIADDVGMDRQTGNEPTMEQQSSFLRGRGDRTPAK